MQTTHRACCRWIRTSFLLNCFFLEIVIVILLRTISFYFSLLFTKRYTSSNIFPISHLLQKIICRNLLIYICIMAIRKCKDKTNDNFTYCNRLAFHCNGNFTNNTCDLSWAWIISTYTPHPTPPPKYLSLEDLMSIPIESSCMWAQICSLISGIEYWKRLQQLLRLYKSRCVDIASICAVILLSTVWRVGVVWPQLAELL